MNTIFLAIILFPLNAPFGIYAVLFGILLLSGLGLPVPEEATLFLAGYLAYLEFVDFWAVLYVMIAGIIAADMIGYAIGRFAGDWLYTLLFHRWRYTRALFEKGKQYTERHGDKVVILSRVFVGVRVAMPILMGHFRMNVVKFMLYDTIAAVPWTVAIVSLSYYLGSGFTALIEMEIIRDIFVPLILGGTAIALTAHYLRYRRNRNLSSEV